MVGVYRYVGQEPILFAASIKDNLAYGLPYVPTDEEIKAACKRANVSVVGIGMNGVIAEVGRCMPSYRLYQMGTIRIVGALVVGVVKYREARSNG